MFIDQTQNFLTCLSPHNGQPLTEHTSHLLSDGELLWPVVDGIPYLRPQHDRREQAVYLLEAGRHQEALILLLQDQDRFAPVPPPDPSVLDELVTDVRTINLRTAMQMLNYGPVADYFAYRDATPTFLSGLALLQPLVLSGQPVIEVACGIGHFLRVLEAQKVMTIGIDVVFSKLWLAQRYLGVRGTLVCADIESRAPLVTDQSHSVFCHDAFYFFEDKTEVLSALRTMAFGGNLALGHVHTDAVDHDVAGFPLSATTYQRMATDDARFFDDTELVRAWLAQRRPPSQRPDQLEHAEAIAWLEGDINQEGFSLMQPAAPLSLNPLLEVTDTGLTVRWPSERFQQEYEAEAGYLQDGPQDAEALRHPERMSEKEKSDLFRKRILLDVPSRW